MEKKRPNESVGFFAYDHRTRTTERGFSPIFITAGLAVLALLAVIGWETTQSLHATNTPAVTLATETPNGTAGDVAPLSNAGPTSATATSSDPISNIGPAILQQLEGAYTQMQQAGVYSSSTAQVVGQSLAPYVTTQISYPTFSAGDLRTDRVTSYARMLQYRSDLRTALAPLLKNTEPEYAIFAEYVDSKDATYLAQLKNVADDYRTAASSTARIVVPADAVPEHVAILNAMEEFASTLDAMAAHATDPFASVALLRSYDQAENDMLSSFNDLTVYYKTKTP